MQDMSQTITAQAPLRYRLSRQINLFLAKSLKVPRVPAIRIARSINIAAAPFEQARRKKLAETIIAGRKGKPQRITIDATNGYRITGMSEVPEIGPAIAQAKAVYDKAVEAEGLALGNAGTSRKVFMQYASEGRDIAQYRDIMKLAVNRPVLDAVTEYLGEVPVIGNVMIMVSVPNETQVGSQLYHLDFADEKQIKFFTYVDAVTPDNGPFTFTPVPETAELVKTYNYDRGRLSIDQVQKAVGAEKEIQVTGPAGTALLCDTSRCMHYGSNRNKTTRIVILIQYTSHAVPEQPPVMWPVDELVRDLKLDDVQKMALSV